MTRLLLIALTGGILAALAGQLAAPYHLLTHEFTQVFTLACGGGLLLLPRRLPGDPTQRLLTTLAMAGALGLGAFATQALLGGLWHGCRSAGTGVYFWVTWPPTALFCAVVGVLTAGWSRRRMLGLLIGLALLDGANVGLQVLRGVRMVDLLIGDLVGFSQRVEMVTTTTHFLQRSWLCGVALLLWTLARRGRAPLTGLVAAPVVAATIFAGSHVGVGPGKAALLTTLDGEHRTKHFVFRYVSTGTAMLYLDPITENAEWQWHRLQRAWDLDDDTVIEVRLFEDYEQLTASTSMTSAHAGPYWMNLPWWSAMRSTFAHELVHTVNVEWTWNPTLLLLRGHSEGVASAWEDDLVLLPEAHAETAGALRSGHLPDADVVMGIGGFTKVDEGNAYTASASFVGWLILTRGFDDYARLQRTLDYEGIYGRSLTALNADWRAFLDALPVDLEEQAAARERFNPALSPSYRSQQCPKLGPKEEDRRERAFRRSTVGDHEAAYADYLALLAEEDTLHTALQAAGSLQNLGRHTEALALLDRPEEGLADDERDKLLQSRTVSLLHTADFDALAETLAARNALQHSPDRAILAACLADPAIQAPLAEALTLGETLYGQLALQTLSREHPDHEGLRHVLATRGVGLSVGWFSRSLAPDQRARLIDELALMAAVPQSCDLRDDDLISTATGLRYLGEDALLAEVLSIASHCTDPHIAVSAQRLSDWQAWAVQR